MNKVYWSITGFSLLIILFSIFFYINFEHTRANSLKNSGNTTQMAGQANSQESNLKAVGANQGDDIRTDSNTEYIEETYDIADAIYQDKQLTIPKEYVGLTREEIQAKLQEYMKQPPAEEVKKGLVSITLNHFSKASITIRKVYDNKENYAYFLTEYGGYLVVYTNDKKTLVDQTGIRISELSEEEQTEVKKGIYLDNLDQLYGLLESYTS